jgi:hypothetical protein
MVVNAEGEICMVFETLKASRKEPFCSRILQSRP